MYISCIQLEIFASKYRKPQYINFSENGCKLYQHNVPSNVPHL